MKFQRKQPCKNCPYRKDALLSLWSIEEFKDLIDSEKTLLGATYGCHKNDDHVCIGWLMDQDNRNLPSISLRISLSNNNVSREYLASLHCKSEMFESVEEMCEANFPGEFE